MSRRAVIGIAVAGAATALIAISLLLAGADEQPTLTYLTSWDTSGVTIAADGSWTTTSDLGYAVTVTGGSLTTYSVTVLACGGADDRALLGVARPEALRPLGTVALGTRTVDVGSYCEAHVGWGATHGDAALAGAPPVETLTVAGTYLAPGTSEPRAFEVSTALSWGVRDDLTIDGGPVVVDLTGPAEITVVRSAATLFDRIDFASDLEQADRAVLRNLATATRFVVSDSSTR